MAFEVQIADPIADAAEISRLVGLGFRTVYPFKDIFQDTEEDEYYKWSLGFTSPRLIAPASVVLKTVELSTNKIVSVLKVHHPHVKTKEALPPTPSVELPVGTNLELFSATFGLMGRLRAENGFDSEKHYMGSVLVTHPDYQRQGHAIRLVRHALKFADETNKKWYAGCWPASASMYKKLGFVYQTMETLDLSKYGASGTATFTLLIREPKPIDSETLGDSTLGDISKPE